MKDIRVVFMGTPDFSVPILSELIKNTNVVLVVTSPDAFIGRKKVLTPCPVKEFALNNNIDVFSPEKIRLDYERIKDAKPDIIITCAYGQILSEEILNIPALGCINIHASLLPKYRGGAPIHHAIKNGEKETGITLMYMDKGMDTGDMIVKESITIGPDELFDSVHDKLSLLGSKMIIEHLPSIINNTNNREKQNNEEATYAPIIKREDEKLDFNKTKEEGINHIRALSPNPYPYFLLDDVPYKIVEAKPVEASGDINQIVEVSKDSFTIMCAGGGIKVTKIKPFGKGIMNVSDYFNGFDKDKMKNKEVNK